MRFPFRIFLGGAAVIGGLVTSAAAQGLAAQMAEQKAYWTPERQRMAVMGNGSNSAASVPSMSPTFQRQLQQRQQQLQQQQQMQQMQMATAQIVGQQLGQMLAQSLFSSGSQQNAQQIAAAHHAEVIRQQQIVAERQARIERAAELRMDWDRRDMQMANDLAEVFSPVSRPPAFFGVEGPDAASVEAALAPESTSLVVPLDAPAVLTSPTASMSDPSVVALDDSKPLVLAPEFLADQQRRAAQTAAYEANLASWGPPPLAPGPAASGSRSILVDKINDLVVDQLKTRVQATAAYANFVHTLEYLPGYEWAVKAKGAYDYAANLRGQFDALSSPIQAEANRSMELTIRGMTLATNQLASPGLGGADLAENYNREVYRQEERYGRMAGDLIKQRVETGLTQSNERDASIMIGSDEPTRVRAVRGEPNSYVRFNIWQQQGSSR